MLWGLRASTRGAACLSVTKLSTSVSYRHFRVMSAHTMCNGHARDLEIPATGEARGLLTRVGIDLCTTNMFTYSVTP